MAAVMTPDEFPEKANALCEVCRLFGERQWCLATSGNFSLRVDDSHCLMTQSGREKSKLSSDDLMICDFDGNAMDQHSKPSSETPLHTCLYNLDTEIGAVLHTHSVASTVLSRSVDAGLTLAGFEMQKALVGVTTHEDSITIPVFENDQNMTALAKRVRQAWADGKFGVPGFLIKGHGLYAWGNELSEAQRHTEGFEFLFACALQEKLVLRG
jgi:methylthioribulose-1-phosphate dehydratase